MEGDALSTGDASIAIILGHLQMGLYYQAKSVLRDLIGDQDGQTDTAWLGFRTGSAQESRVTTRY
jgi:hypothetical protein